ACAERTRTQTALSRERRARGYGSSWLKSQVPLLGWPASGGGVSQCGEEKSKNSIIESAVASRAVSAGNLKRVSIMRRIDPKSRQVCETRCGRTHGEITISGTR